MDDVTLNIVENWDEAQDFMRWLGQRREILACDTETGGLDWWRDPLRLVQFGDLTTGWVVPWERWGGLAVEALDRYTVRFVNATPDVRTRSAVHFWPSQVSALPSSPTGTNSGVISVSSTDASTSLTSSPN